MEEASCTGIVMEVIIVMELKIDIAILILIFRRQSFQEDGELLAYLFLFERSFIN